MIESKTPKKQKNNIKKWKKHKHKIVIKSEKHAKKHNN